MKGLYQTEDGSSFFSIEIFQKAPNKSLFKITLPNGVVVRDVCDGQAAWTGGCSWRAITSSEVARRPGQPVALYGFCGPREGLPTGGDGKSHRPGKGEGRNNFTVEYMPEKNVVSRIYFDVDSGYIVHTEDMYSTKDGPYSVKLDLDDYRDVAGLKIHGTRMRRVEKGVVLNIRLVQVDVNAPIDDSIFLKPESAPK